MWIILALVSSVFLGHYDVFKKSALNKNSVLPVLFFSSLTSAFIFIPFIFISRYTVILDDTSFFVPVVSPDVHLLLLIKSIIVGSSWVLAYFALKYLPLTIVSPVRATGPLWTVLGAVIIFSETLSYMQWLGVCLTIVFLIYFSFAGRREGILFIKDKWIWAIFGATIIGAASGLYDKFLIERIDRFVIQSWFSIYMVLVYFPLMFIIWYPNRSKPKNKFKWRWAIPFIGIFLSIADFAYFYSLSFDDAMISIISVLRRSSVIISFTLAAIIFKEVNIKRKAFALIGILAGVSLIIFSS